MAQKVNYWPMDVLVLLVLVVGLCLTLGMYFFSCDIDEDMQYINQSVGDVKKVAAQLVVGERTVFCYAEGDNEVTLVWSGKEGAKSARVNLEEDGGPILKKKPE